MKIMSFNVNGIRARTEQLEFVLRKHNPDVIGLQETKVEDALFPVEDFNALGYDAYFHGQKGHYGVALLYRTKLISSQKGFASDDENAQRRLVKITLDTPKGDLHIYNGYFPQGENRQHPTKFEAKTQFYKNLQQQLVAEHSPDDRVIVIGDMNIALEDKDIGIGEVNRKRWLREGKCCFLPEEREWLTTLNDSLDLTDTFDHQTSSSGDHRYSWFDYRSKGYDKEPKRGLRIDLILATKSLINAQKSAGIDQDVRAMNRPSDHCPIWADFIF